MKTSDTTPRPPAGRDFAVTSEEKAKALSHYNKMGEQYDEQVTAWPLSHFREKERRAVEGLLELQPGLSLIDMGCGTGYYSRLALARGLNVESMDFNASMLTPLKGKVREIHVGDIEDFSLPRTFDRVVCAGVMDFVAAPDRALDCLARLVAPGGKLVLLMPRKGWGGVYYRIEKWVSGFKVNLYEQAWVASELSQRGLELEEVRRPLPTNMALAFRKPADPTDSK